MAEDNVVKFNGITRLDMPAELVLNEALKHGLENVVIMGYDEDGEEWFSSSLADGGTVLWLMERLKTKLLAVPDGELFQ